MHNFISFPLGIQTARTHARTHGTTRNDFPVGLTPPNLRYVAYLLTSVFHIVRKCLDLLRSIRRTLQLKAVANLTETQGHSMIGHSKLMNSVKVLQKHNNTEAWVVWGGVEWTHHVS
jgi:hypothetical protein